MKTYEWVIMLGIFLVFLLVFQWSISKLAARRKSKARLLKHGLYQIKHEQKEKKETVKDSKPSLIKRTGRKLDGLNFLQVWNKPLQHANSRLSPGEFFLLRFMLLITVVFIAKALGLHLIFLISAGIIAYWIPGMMLKKKIETRLTRSSYQLAEALGTMANSMRAGFSFLQAMKLISEEYGDPIGREFEKTLQDIRYGVPVEEAFVHMIERLPDKELELAVKAMMIQRQSGGNMAVLLETIQETISGRILIKEEVKTLTAQGKLSSWIITALPIGLAFYLKLVNPQYFELLFGHPLGIVMMSMACIGIVMGWIVIRKIVRIEV